MIEELLNYQVADADLRKIEIGLSNSEERKKAITAKKYLETVEDNLKKLELKAAGLNASYEKAQDDIKKLKDQETEFINAGEEAKDVNAIDYLVKKVDELLNEIKRISALSSKINEDIQNVLKEYASIRSNTKSAQVQYTENVAKYSEQKNAVAEEKQKIEKELDKLRKKVDPKLMELYLKKRANKMYPIVYEVKGDVCGACNMQLPMSELNRLKNGEIIECDQCGRILYKK